MIKTIYTGSFCCSKASRDPKWKTQKHPTKNQEWDKGDHSHSFDIELETLSRKTKQEEEMKEIQVEQGRGGDLKDPVHSI